MVIIYSRYDHERIILRRDDLNSLQGADLGRADLRGADLTGADLRGADLRGADLRGANLCYANLCGADLRNADLRGADLTCALLTDADLEGVQLPDSIPILDRPYSRILERIKGGMGIEMRKWHACETTHCLAGWLIHLCGDEGYELEEELGSSAAGTLIHARNRPDARVPDFNASNEDAMAYIVSQANEESAKSTG